MDGWLEACFAGLPDPRSGNATRHDPVEAVTIALVASICGAESCVDFADFARDREALFREFLRLEGGLPSHDTFSRLFRLLDPAAFGACFGRFLDGLGQGGRGVVAVDAYRMATHDAAVGLADQALYAAKHQGRDRYIALEFGLSKVDPAATTALPLREASMREVS